MKIKSAYISTIDKEIHVGREYGYTEGSFIAIVKLLENNSNSELIALKLIVIRSNRSDMPGGSIFSVDAAYHNFGYSGMWRLLDPERYYKVKFSY